MGDTPGIVNVYYCYASEDIELLNKLAGQLAPLRKARKLTTWFDKEIQSGSDWKVVIEEQLQKADLILLLVSPAFILSEYCYDLQLTRALNHYEAGKVEIMPIILRPVLWEETVIRRLPLILPTSQLPVTKWADPDDAFLNVATAIRDLIKEKALIKNPHPAQEILDEITEIGKMGSAVLSTCCPLCGSENRVGARFCTKDGTNLLDAQVRLVPKPLPPVHTKEEWLEEGIQLGKQNLAAEALAAYDQALLLDTHYAQAYFYKGHILYGLQQYNAALDAYQQAARCDPHSAAPHCYTGHTLRHLNRHLEAFAAYEQALLQNAPSEICAAAWNGKGRIFAELKQAVPASSAYDKAIQLNPGFAEPYLGKGILAYEAGKHEEALILYDKALSLQADYAAAYFYKGNVLFDLKRYPEALACYDQTINIVPHYAAAYYGKGRIYEWLGLMKEAKEAYARADSLKPSSQA